MGNTSGHCEPGAYADRDSFPWHMMPKTADIGMGKRDRVFAVYVGVGVGSAGCTVSRRLEVGMGSVRVAYVFDKVNVGMGHITELHCLHGTKIQCGMGKIKNTIYHSVDELVALASGVCAIALPQPAQLPPGWTLEKTADGKVYYLDHNTKTSHWTPPVYAPAPAAPPAYPTNPPPNTAQYPPPNAAQYPPGAGAPHYSPAGHAPQYPPNNQLPAYSANPKAM